MPFQADVLWVLLIIVLLFGASRLPKLARSIGQASKEFREGLKEGAVDQPVEGPCPYCSVQVPGDAKFCPGCGKSSAEIVAKKKSGASSA